MKSARSFKADREHAAAERAMLSRRHAIACA
jgi:hypothetical protein